MAPADALAERLLQRFPPGPAYTVDALRRDGLPRALAHFIEQALLRRLAMEREVLDAARDSARSPWFDAAMPAAEQAWDAYFDALGTTARVPADEWPHALRQAARQVTAYLLRPASALVGFVFADEQGTLPAEVVLRRMRYFAAYPYLQDVVRAFVHDKHLDTLDRKGFASLLQRIEAHAADRYQGDAWGVLLDDLFDTLGEGTPPALSGALLAPLFGDKGLPDVARRLAASPAPLTRAEVVRMLGGGAPEPPPAAPVPPAVEAPPSAAPLEEAPTPADLPPIPSPRDSPAPVLPEAEAPPMRPRAALPPEPSQAAPRVPRTPATNDLPPLPRPRPLAPPPPAPPVAPAAPVDDRRPLWQRVMGGRRTSGEDDPNGLDTLEARALGALAPAQRQTIVRQVFGGDAGAYAEALRRLAEAPSWTEAARTLLALFEERGVDLYAPAAIAFTDAAEQRFL